MTAKTTRFELPGVRLVNPTNEHRDWRVRHARAKTQRSQARVVAQGAGVHLLPLPVVVTITRRGPGRLDSDSLPPSGKHVRDGIADAMGIDDGDETKATWTYRQERAEAWSVLVEVHCVAPAVATAGTVQARSGGLMGTEPAKTRKRVRGAKEGTES